MPFEPVGPRDQNGLAESCALEGVRVVELAGPASPYCGKMLRGLGAEVILVEPPGGCALRRQPPYLDGDGSAPESLAFLYYAAGKRSVVIDLDSAPSRDKFRALIGSADILIECEPPGALTARGLGYKALATIRPSLVMASITPFGQDGPWADWRAEDIVAMALGGMMWMGGYKGGAPLVPAGEQALLAAGMFAAVSALAGFLAAERDGEGDHIDISVQECVVLGLENSIQFWELEGTLRMREGGYQSVAGRGAFRCADGYVYIMAGGIDSNRFWSNTVAWLEAGSAPGAERLRHPRWLDRRFLETDEAKSEFREIFGGFAVTRSKTELYHEGQARRVPVAPVETPADIAASPQLAARNFFVKVTDAARDRIITMPGPPYRLAATPWVAGGPAPALGQDHRAVFDRLAGVGQ